MKTRRFYFLISLITLLGMGQGHLKASNNEETITLKFVETSDVHGCYFPYDFIQNKQMRGSLARVSSYVKEEREVYGDNLILMDNGDILQGQPVAYYYNYMDTASVRIPRRVLCMNGWFPREIFLSTTTMMSRSLRMKQLWMAGPLCMI